MTILWTYNHRKLDKAKWQFKNDTKNVDYTTVADKIYISLPMYIVPVFRTLSEHIIA